MNRDHQLSVRIPTAMYRALELEAYNERRSVADVINIMLEERYPANRRQPPSTVIEPRKRVLRFGDEPVKLSKPSKKVGDK